MRQKYIHGYLIVWLFSSFCNVTMAQSFTAGDIITLQVNDYSLIETNHAPVVLTMSGSVAGAPVSSASNSDMFLKLSSLVPGGTAREVTARISSGSVPQGTSLSVVAAPCTLTNSGGNLGNVVITPINLSSIDQNLIIGIGSCYTGTGYNDGYKLTYKWSPTNLPASYGLIQSTTSPVNITVVYTITAHNGN